VVVSMLLDVGHSYLPYRACIIDDLYLCHVAFRGRRDPFRH
jgi:hypothetical protein